MSEDPRWWFELHAPVFDRFDAPLGRYYDDTREMSVELLNLPDERASRVLDLGAGTGNVAVRVLERYPLSHVILLDASEGMLSQARPKLEAYPGRVSFNLVNIEQEALSGAYDAVLSCDALHHVPLDRRWELFREVSRSLPPGGAFVYVDILAEPEPPPVAAAYSRIDQRHRSRVYAEQGWTAESAARVIAERTEARRTGAVYGSEAHSTSLDEVRRQLSAAGFDPVHVAWQYFGRFLVAAYRGEDGWAPASGRSVPG